jgi:hypothetical protein
MWPKYGSRAALGFSELLVLFAEEKILVNSTNRHNIKREVLRKRGRKYSIRVEENGRTWEK